MQPKTKCEYSHRLKFANSRDKYRFTSAPLKFSFSANSTRRGKASRSVVSSLFVRKISSLNFAPATVIGVAITSARESLPFISSAAFFTAGSIPIIGALNFARSSFIAALVAVLQAITTAFAPLLIKNSTAREVNFKICSRDFNP